MELISRNPEGMRMVDILEQLPLPKASAHMLLQSLVHLGYLSKTDSNYFRLSFKLFTLAARATSGWDLSGIAKPHLEALSAYTGITVHLAGLEGHDVVYLAKINSPGLVRFNTYVGKRSPAHLTAVGKAILAHLPAAKLDEVINTLNFSVGTDLAIKSANDLREHLAIVQQNGYAVEDGEEVAGVCCVSAPICLDGAIVAGSVGIMGLRSTLSDSQLALFAAETVRTAQLIAKDLASVP